MYAHMWIMCVNIYLVYACTHMYMKREIGVLASYQSETYGKGSDSMSETWALHSPGDKCLAAPHLINSSFSIVIHIRSCKQSLGQKNHNLYFYGGRSKIPAKGKQETKSKQVSSREWGPPGNPSVLVTIREWLRSELPPSRRKDLPEEQASHRAQGSHGVPAGFLFILLKSGHSQQRPCQPQNCWLFCWLFHCA